MPAKPTLELLVLARRPGDGRRKGRTLRALRRAGFSPIDGTSLSGKALAERIAGRAMWLLRAGAIPAGEGPFETPPPSGTGKPLAALGAVLPGADFGASADTKAWAEALATTGGDFARLGGRPLPPFASMYCDPAFSTPLAARIAAGDTIERATASVAATGGARVLRFALLDVHDDERLRAVLSVTSLQQGGAERVVLDLANALPAHGVLPRVVTLGRPTRAAFPAPPGTIELFRAEDRIASLAEIANEWAADLIHGHLLTGDEVSRLAAMDAPPVVLTIHNTRPGWPAGLERLRKGDAALLVACSLAAEADLTPLPIPRRTAWNGIDTARLRPAAALRARGAALRKQLGFGDSDLLLLSIANPRPQKRLERLPAVLAAARAELSRRGVAREARLVIVGDADPRRELAAASARQLREAIASESMESHVRLTGSMDDVTPALFAADVLVSVSAHEGLSLAHLEALSAGLPVVATDAGGTTELLAEGPAVAVLPLETGPSEIAVAAVDHALGKAELPAPALTHFTRERMAERYAALYRRAIPARGGRGGGLVLITNNFSTGGAQSSARRLLLGLKAEGARVRAAVLEEQPAWPTPGRRALESAGVPVLSLPPAGTIDAAEAVEELLEELDEDPPDAVLFWNALVPYKLLLADALLDVPVFDVSPGEMYFASLARYFQRPRPGLPYRDVRAYGERLAGVIVKYAAEAAQAAELLGAPVFVVPNGITLGPTPPARRSHEKLVIGTAARISPQKKLSDLLDALWLAHSSLPPWEMRIAGGPERGAEDHAAALRQKAAGLPVTWLGDLPETAPFLAELDVFAMISEPAGCPNASLEAMAAGLPVIATDVGGASEQVVDGVTGRLLPRGDVRGFAEALIALGRDEGARRALGAAGRARAEARFDVRRMVADYRRICLPHAMPVAARDGLG